MDTFKRCMDCKYLVANISVSFGVLEGRGLGLEFQCSVMCRVLLTKGVVVPFFVITQRLYLLFSYDLCQLARAAVTKCHFSSRSEFPTVLKTRVQDGGIGRLFFLCGLSLDLQVVLPACRVSLCLLRRPVILGQGRLTASFNPLLFKDFVSK